MDLISILHSNYLICLVFFLGNLGTLKFHFPSVFSMKYGINVQKNEKIATTKKWNEIFKLLVKTLNTRIKITKNEIIKVDLMCEKPNFNNRWCIWFLSAFNGLFPDIIRIVNIRIVSNIGNDNNATITTGKLLVNFMGNLLLSKIIVET